MLGFWEALESATAANPAAFDASRSAADRKAVADAGAFYEEMMLDRDRLSGLGVEVTRLDSTVSFRRNGYGVVSVHFGAGNADGNRVVSAVAAHLKLEPSYEDVPSDRSVGPVAGRWLGRSMDLIAKNPEVFARFGLV